MSTTLTDRIEHLRQRASDLAAQLTSLSDKRRSYSLAATQGDETARKRIVDADFEADSLRKEEMTIHSAIEVGEALDKQQALETERQQQREKEIAAYGTARAVITLHEEIDAELVKLREMFERRAVLLAGLSVDSMTVARLSNKSGPTRAACHAGLHKYFDVMTVPVPSMQPLSSANALLVGIGVKPGGSPAGYSGVQRVKLKERA